ncbi:MAG: HEAT repeat domain-containing protein [Armatimonadetes bacterium]|nr:HEAT repeat domain-containing protein [Armatimonadota bacterium]
MLRSINANKFALWATFSLTLGIGASALIAPPRPAKPPKSAPALAQKPLTAPATTPDKEIILLKSRWAHAYNLKAGQVVEISVRLLKPSELPANGRVGVAWSLQNEPTALSPVGQGRAVDAFGIYNKPSAGWRKTLNAHDGDIYLVYRAPQTGTYHLNIAPVTDETPIGSQSVRWRERGNAPRLAELPVSTPWQANASAPLNVSVKPLNLGSVGDENRLQTLIEQKPNDTPEMAQTIELTPANDDSVKAWEIAGGADDIEFFDNGKVGASGDSWFRLEYKGNEARLLTAQLSMPTQKVVARIRAYHLKGSDAGGLGKLLPIEEWKEGQDGNERVHQQDEEHRSNISRLLKPHETYFLRVEANTPGYQLELRLLKPAPYTDPRIAIRQAIYTQIGQVDAWLTNRPRGASVERRIRDSGNLLGTQCMSCHTHSGVWGPAVPFANGYRPENVQNYWHLINTMYECLRPCNVLKDAVNNTSLAPLDIGDGPAGTRAAGFNIVNLERIRKPSKLHSRQQVRTANFVLQTSDPGGINAAGPGSNIGFVIVNLFATEILKTAWEKTNEPKYFRGMEQKARQALEAIPQYTDDIALRLDYFNRVFPIAKYIEWAGKADTAEGKPLNDKHEERTKFVAQVEKQLQEDETRLRATQNDDGSWGFHPGNRVETTKKWARLDSSSDPSPTALGIIGLTAAGHGVDDPATAKAVKALLAMQDSSGRWNRAAQTGFVTTGYALHALSRLYPITPKVHTRADFTAKPGESLLATLKRVQSLALLAEPKLNDILAAAIKHPNPQVRYWAAIGLGANRLPSSVAPLLTALADPTKIVRHAASWALHEELLNDNGWEAAYNAYDTGDDNTREGIVQALSIRADATSTKARINWSRLTTLIDRAMNTDKHPAVRSWATKAAWEWWVWNPPARTAINAAWIKLLERPEPNLTTENALRYSSQALFIANGHKANGSGEHQYLELETLFRTLAKRLIDIKEPEARLLLAKRLVGIGGTFYETAGGDGGPGPMGYVTPGSGEMMGAASLIYLKETTAKADLAAIRAGLEGGANVPNQELNRFLVDYSLSGPEELRQLAAAAVSDPRSVSLQAVPEQVEPQMVQIKRGAMEPARRQQISEPILGLWARVNWIIPKTEEQQRNFFSIVIPRFGQYLSPEELAALPDPAKKAALQREMEANWYLADRLGDVLFRNPDLHQEIVFRKYFPTTFQNPLEEHFWIRSVEWLLTFSSAMRSASTGARTVALQQGKQEAPDEALSIKDRALQLYLDSLKPTANPQTRAIAIRMSNQTALRKNPEVLRALNEVLTFEKNKELRQVIENVLRQGTERFIPELIEALKAEKHLTTKYDDKGNPLLTNDFRDDIVYFRDYVVPELSRQKRNDQQSCMGCHGLPGKVPSFYVRPPDKFGYISPADLLVTYRTVQSKVRFDELEKSKILRKPLNVQDGKEDGHQGGRRYTPNDPGYLLLRKWVENQPRLLKKTE